MDMENENENVAEESCEKEQIIDADSGNQKESDSDLPEKKDNSSRIEELEKENADLKDQLLRRAADFDNYRKRMLQEKQDAFDYANTNLLKDLLESLDNFDRTVDAAANAVNPKQIADGIKIISKNLVNMLENKYNLSSFGEKGDVFNPDIHEAIGSMQGKTEEPKIAEVYLKGYKLKEKVIRHAKVMVLMPESESEKSE